eukprot:m51a1_g4151 putative e3 ubiquitin-protein ligase fancl (370) ;mRNA; r:247146-248617
MSAVLVPTTASLDVFEGYVGLEYEVSLRVASAGRAVTHVSSACPQLLAAASALLSRIAASGAVDWDECVKELVHAAEVCASAPQGGDGSSTAGGGSAEALCAWEAVLCELDQIDVSAHLRSADASARTLLLCTADAAGREHSLRVEVPADYPRTPPRTAHELPRPLPSGGTSVRAAWALFCAAVDAYQALWEQLDAIDARAACVGSSDARGPSSVSRRLIIDRDLTVQVSLDPQHPREMPDVWVLGPESHAAPLRQRLAQGRARWDQQRGVVDNLEAILGVAVAAPPRPNASEASQVEGPAPCGVCLAHELEGEPPTRVCDNPACRQPFHAECLYQWLRSAGAACDDAMLGVVFGRCPYCEHRISAKAP